MVTDTGTRRFTADEYHLMGDAGVFREDERVELIEGEIRPMAPNKAPHATTVMRLTELFVINLHGIARVTPQNPVRLAEDSEPQPDFAILRPREYVETPTSDDILMLVEVSDTSLSYDRGTKLRLYARSGIPEVWIVDIGGEAIERYSAPASDSYSQVLRAGRGERLQSTVLLELSLPVDAILPPPAI